MVTGGTIGRDVGFDYHCAEGTERVSLMVGLVDDSGSFEVVSSMNDYNEWSLHDGVVIDGYHFQTPGTYQIRIEACTWYYGEEPSETIADSETAIYEFTLEDTVLPTITVELSATKTEYDYGDSELDNLTYSISGVDNVALAWWVYSEQTDDVNGSSLSGGYESFGRLDADAGRNEYTFYGRVNDVWSKPVTKIITVFPLLDVPAIYYNGNYVDSAWIITDGESPIFTVESDNATAFTCTVLKELEDGSEDTLAYAESSNGVIDLTSYNLPLGTYYLSFGVSSDRWTSPDNKRITLTITDSPVLPAPTITVAPGTSHQGMAITVTGSEDTDKIEVSVEGIMNNGEGNELYSGSVNNGGTLTVPGWFIDGNNYKITATGKRLESEEGSVQTWAYGNQAVLAVTREDPATEPTHTNTMTFNTTEGVSGQVTLTVDGAEAIAYHAIYEGLGGGRPDEYHDGSTVTLEAENSEFGRYVIDCWARFSGYWYWVNSGEVTLLPSAELAVPAVSLNGRALTRNTLQTVALADPMTLSASCADADGIGYVVQKVNGSFNMDLVRFTEDGSYVEYGSHTGLDGYDDNDYDWESYFVASSLGTASSVNILDQMTLTPGDYRVRIVAACEDTSIKAGQFVAWLHITSAPSGSCGENVNWSLNDGTLTISGTGDMTDYSATGDPAPWSDYADEIYSIEIADGVTHIGTYAFRGCTIDTIEFPASITSIGASAFADCTSLIEVSYAGSRSGWEAINITPEGNEYLLAAELICAVPDEGQITAAFDAATGRLTISGSGRMPQYMIEWNAGYCASDAPWSGYRDSIRSIVIESGVTSISRGAFAGCAQLAQVTLPDSVTDIGGTAFYGCASLTGIRIPDGIVSIHQETFYGCSSLAQVSLPDGLLLIDSAAFSNCSSLTGVTFPASLTAIRNQAFENCSSLSSIEFPEGLKSLGATAFAECGLTSVTTYGLIRIRHFFYADENGNHLYHIDLPYGLTDLDTSAFYGNPLPYDTPDFVLPSDLHVIEAEAFSGIDARYVWLPDGITSIDSATPKQGI